MHLNVEPLSVEENLNVAESVLIVPVGPEVMVVSGASSSVMVPVAWLSGIVTLDGLERLTKKA